jgi:3-hydroxyisobutyrate dehydrogenase-like beta-hydroxyacid dehydrogenase
MSIAFFGAGLLGAAMIERFVRAGTSVTVWNRSPDRLPPLVALGARTANTPADALRDAQRVHVVLRDDASVDEVLASCGAALRDVLVIDHTTVTPQGARARAERFAREGVRFLHAPVFMGPSAARAGGGSMFVSGPESVYAAAADALATMTAKVVYLGAEPHLAATLKLVGNTMIIGINAALADAFAVAVGAGVSPAQAMSLFDTFDPCGTIAGRGRAMATGDYRASFELTMARKDVQLMLETAASGGQVPHVLPAIAHRMDALIAEGHGARDFAVLAVDTIPTQVG